MYHGNRPALQFLIDQGVAELTDGTRLWKQARQAFITVKAILSNPYQPNREIELNAAIAELEVCLYEGGNDVQVKEELTRAYSVEEAAERLSMSPWTVRKWLQDKKIASV